MQGSGLLRTLRRRAKRATLTSRRVACPSLSCSMVANYAHQAAGKERLHSAEATANGYAADARGAVTKQYDAAKASATDAYNATAAKVGDAENAAKATYDDAKHKAQETQQSWGAWLGSWVGYGKSKAQEAESRAAADVAAGAAKVQREAEKRQ